MFLLCTIDGDVQQSYIEDHKVYKLLTSPVTKKSGIDQNYSGTFAPLMHVKPIVLEALVTSIMLKLARFAHFLHQASGRVAHFHARCRLGLHSMYLLREYTLATLSITSYFRVFANFSWYVDV